MTLLRYMVEHSLAGQSTEMKERRLGIEVFGRPADYDSNADPVVRTSANEIRKRLAQYYQEVDEPGRPYIRLSPGSYATCFEFPLDSLREGRAGPDDGQPWGNKGEPHSPMLSSSDDESRSTKGLEQFPQVLQTDDAIQPSLGRTRRHKFVWVAGAVFVLLIAACGSFLFLTRANSDSALNRFWSPIFNSPVPVQICVGALDLTGSVDPGAPFSQKMADQINGKVDLPVETGQATWRMVMFADAEKMARISELLTKHNKKFLIHSSDSVTLEELRRGPAVQIGIFANLWTLRLLPKLRFHPHMDFATQMMWIEDSQHPEKNDWRVPWAKPYSQSYVDYAIVTRCRDSLSGQGVIAIGGLGLHGTEAAGDFVTNSDDLSQLSSDLGNPNKNVQIVLKIIVVNGNAGPPQIIAVHYW